MPTDVPLYLAFLSLTVALVITPGATTAVVVRNTLDGGTRGGLWAAAGAAVANSTHAAVAGLGLAVLIARVPRLLTAVQIAGGGYLLWLGIQSARRVRQHRALPISGVILAGVGRRQAHHAWREGVAVNLLNPAIATFYLAVVPTFLPASAARGDYLWLAATHVGLAFLVHSLWAVALDRLRARLARPGARATLELVTAAALLLLGARVLADALA